MKAKEKLYLYLANAWKLLFIVTVFFLLSGCALYPVYHLVKQKSEDWDRAESRGTIEAYEQYLQKYPDSKNADIAHLRIEEILSYTSVRQKDNILAYKEFIKDYPNGILSYRAYNRILELKFQKTKNAEKLEYERAIKAGDIESYRNFISKYYDSKFAEEAKGKIYKIVAPEFAKVKEIGTIEAFKEFITKYPELSTLAKNDFKYSILREIKKIDLSFEEKVDDLIKKELIKKLISCGFILGGAECKVKMYVKAKKLNKRGPLLTENKDEIRRQHVNGGYFTIIGDYSILTVDISATHYDLGEIFIKHFEGIQLWNIGDSIVYHPETKEIISADLKLAESAVHNLCNSASFRILAVEILGHFGHSIKPLITALKDNDYEIKMAAVEAISNIKDKRAIEALINILKNEDYSLSVRKAAAQALGNIKDKRAVGPLIDLLKNKDYYRIQKAVAQALGNIKDQRAVSPLINLLKTEYSYNQEAAARALGKIKDKRAVGPLIDVMKDEDCNSNLREASVQALGNIKDQRAVGPLIKAWKKSEKLHYGYGLALSKITGVNFKKNIGYIIAFRKWKEWWKQNKGKISDEIQKELLNEGKNK